RIVSTRFQVLFHSPHGVLFTIPSRYSIHYRSQQVFRLTEWSRQIHSRFHEPAATREKLSTHTLHAFTYRTLTVYGRPFQTTSANTQHTRGPWQQPTTKTHNPTHTTPARYHTHLV